MQTVFSLPDKKTPVLVIGTQTAQIKKAIIDRVVAIEPDEDEQYA